MGTKKNKPGSTNAEPEPVADPAEDAGAVAVPATHCPEGLAGEYVDFMRLEYDVMQNHTPYYGPEKLMLAFAAGYDAAVNSNPNDAS